MFTLLEPKEHIPTYVLYSVRYINFCALIFFHSIFEGCTSIRVMTDKSSLSHRCFLRFSVIAYQLDSSGFVKHAT